MPVLFPKSVYTPAIGSWGLGYLDGYPCSGSVSSVFGATDISEHVEGHNGTDIAAATDTPVFAPCAMAVTDVFSIDIQSTNPLFSQIKEWFGNSVWCEFESDGVWYRTMFAHLAYAPAVGEGEYVETGQLLGYVGSTGMSTGPHLHWTLGPSENRWLARNSGNVDVLDYCTSEMPAEAPVEAVSVPEVMLQSDALERRTLLIRAIQDARAAIDRATRLIDG